MEKDYEMMSSELNALRQSNKLMEEELDRLRNTNNLLRKSESECRNYIVRLLRRGLFDRILNRK